MLNKSKIIYFLPPQTPFLAQTTVRSNSMVFWPSSRIIIGRYDSYRAFKCWVKINRCCILNSIVALQKKLGNCFHFFAFFMVCLGVVWFIIGSKWLIKAWGHIPIFVWTCLELSIFAKYGPSDPYLLPTYLKIKQRPNKF